MKPLTDQECLDGRNRICDMAKQVASESGIRLQSVQLDDGLQVICKKSHSLQMSARGKTVTVTITHIDVSGSEMTKPKIPAAVDRLKSMLQV